MALTALATEIIRHSEILDSYIAANNLPEPSFDLDGPLDFPIPASAGRELQASRTALLSASKALHDLTAGPTAAIVWSTLTHPYELLMLRTLHRFSIPQAVPLNQGATFSEIALKTGLDEEFVSRIIKYACSYHIFRESSGTVVHTAGSRAFVDHCQLRDCLSVCLDGRFQAMASMVDQAVMKYGGVSENNQTAFNMAFGTDDDYLAYLRRPEERQMLRAMHGCLGYIMTDTNMGTRVHDADTLVARALDWEILGEGLVVDMGGAHGHVSASIARRHPNLRFIVQDLPMIVADGERALSTTADSEEISSRISFMAHDFLTPQTVLAADVYMFRFVMHDWSDKYVIRILQNLLPAMKMHTRILIMDYMLAEPNTVPKVVERMERTMDLYIMAIMSGKERSSKDWRQLVEKTHGRLKIARIETDASSAFGIVELIL